MAVAADADQQAGLPQDGGVLAGGRAGDADALGEFAGGTAGDDVLQDRGPGPAEQPAQLGTTPRGRAAAGSSARNVLDRVAENRNAVGIADGQYDGSTDAEERRLENQPPAVQVDLVLDRVVGGQYRPLPEQYRPEPGEQPGGAARRSYADIGRWIQRVTRSPLCGQEW